MGGNTHGLRRRTRDKFAKPFRGKGAIKISKYLTTFKIGDYVDIVADAAIQKGMPFKYYHGKTGKIFNVNPRSVGVVVTKPIRNKVLQKKIHVKIEHVRLSNCRKAFVSKIQENDKLKAEANKAGKKISTKRQPIGPKTAHSVNVEKVVFQNPDKFRDVC